MYYLADLPCYISNIVENLINSLFIYEPIVIYCTGVGSGGGGGGGGQGGHVPPHLFDWGGQ